MVLFEQSYLPWKRRLLYGVGYTCNPPRRAPPPQGASALLEHMVAIGTQLNPNPNRPT